MFHGLQQAAQGQRLLQRPQGQRRLPGQVIRPPQRFARLGVFGCQVDRFLGFDDGVGQSIEFTADTPERDGPGDYPLAVRVTDESDVATTAATEVRVANVAPTVQVTPAETDTAPGEMVSLETESDRTLFFDLLPIEVGTIGGFKTRLQLYTVPGQVFYNTTRKLVLKGVDGLVFVADSQRPMRDANMESFNSLKENLKELGLELDQYGAAFQYAPQSETSSLLNLRDIDFSKKENFQITLPSAFGPFIFHGQSYTQLSICGNGFVAVDGHSSDAEGEDGASVDGGDDAPPAEPYCGDGIRNGTEICDDVDNCPAHPNFDQTDSDSDGLGDDCDPAWWINKRANAISIVSW